MIQHSKHSVMRVQPSKIQIRSHSVVSSRYFYERCEKISFSAKPLMVFALTAKYYKIPLGGFYYITNITSHR